MGGVVCGLSSLVVQSGCRPSAVAGILAFHPPDPPYYSFVSHNDSLGLVLKPVVGIPASEIPLPPTTLRSTDTGESCLTTSTTSGTAIRPPTDTKSKYLENDLSIEAIISTQNISAATGALLPSIDGVPSVWLEVHCLRTPHNTRRSVSHCIPVLIFRVAEPNFTLVYSHGNATDLGGMFPVYRFIAQTLQVNVVGYDYTGYGVSQCFGLEPNEDRVCGDIDFLMDWLVNTRKLVSDLTKDVILYGQSVGSGPSCYFASRCKVAGLILHSPILSGLHVLTPSRFLAPFDIFPNFKRISKVECPVFIIHGLADEVVASDHGKDLYKLVREDLRHEPWWVPRRGHNNVLTDNQHEFVNRMRRFITVCHTRSDTEEKKS